MSEWKTYKETIEEYNIQIDAINNRLNNEIGLSPHERSALSSQLSSMIRAVANMRPYAEREKQVITSGTNDKKCQT